MPANARPDGIRTRRRLALACGLPRSNGTSLGHENSVSDSGWPAFDATLAAEETVAIVVQVDGKVRGTVDAARGLDAAATLSLARKDPSITRHLPEDPGRVIHVPDRLLNVVTKAR